MKQQCTLPHLYFALIMFAIFYAGGVVLFALKHNWPVLLSVNASTHYDGVTIALTLMVYLQLFQDLPRCGP